MVSRIGSWLAPSPGRRWRAVLALAGVAGAAAWGAARAQPSPAAASAPTAAGAPLEVQVPSLARPGTPSILVPAYWFVADGVRSDAAAGGRPRGAVVLLHGCGGPYGAGGRAGGLGSRMREYAALFNRMGLHVLVTDSFSPRGERELCTQPLAQRRVNQIHRRVDALGALAWLAGQPEVDPHRLGLVGWSHGGSAVLSATNLEHEAVKAAPSRSAFSVAFYPGCSTELARGYRPAGALLMLLGAADDWTPPQPCEALAAASTGVQVESYAGAYHGFDGPPPVRLRRDVPNGVNPGQGVHLGGDPQARSAALSRLAQFLAPWAEPGAPR